MDILVSVENFEEGGGNYREINSPRTLEACLRSGLVPAELYPQPRKHFHEPGITKEMAEVKYNFFEKKRLEKIDAVRKERNIIMSFSEKRGQSPVRAGQGTANMTAEQMRIAQAEKAAALIALVR